MPSPRIILYNVQGSHFGQRVWLALEQAKANYTFHDFQFTNPRPEWYLRHINPSGAIPAIAFDVPENFSPTDPPPGTVGVNESLAILEFLAEALPDANLLPTDLAARAACAPSFSASSSPSPRPSDELTGTARRYPDEPTGRDGGFVFGQCAISEVPAGEGRKAWEAYTHEERFARLRTYVADVFAHPIFKATWDLDAVLATWTNYDAVKRA
ncbi:uncharacterized protein BXZ73DRAFT_107598 [Epithele typhae]|uniref:uncharacterized protein n=1 Tax=Epithele typhae TaxID=378194 RepID=UPI0020086970|nr:uncharacterized protein BXZ73DRAFT_107598 [Epithele typhae]KAH9912156.1 hypothetical protein BXZ73DRAFT_107598 [Epithele typhae]